MTTIDSDHHENEEQPVTTNLPDGVSPRVSARVAELTGQAPPAPEPEQPVDPTVGPGPWLFPGECVADACPMPDRYHRHLADGQVEPKPDPAALDGEPEREPTEPRALTPDEEREVMQPVADAEKPDGGSWSTDSAEQPDDDATAETPCGEVHGPATARDLIDAIRFGRATVFAAPYPIPPTFEERAAALRVANEVLGPKTSGGFGGSSLGRPAHEIVYVADWLLGLDSFDDATGETTDDEES